MSLVSPIREGYKMSKTIDDIIKTEKPEVVAEAKLIADETLRKIQGMGDNSSKTDSDQPS